MNGVQRLGVLLVGETGVGKGLVARELHRAAAERRDRSGPLVILDCPSIPPAWAEVALFGRIAGAFTGTDPAHQGPFELAAGGTVFIDGIDVLTDHLQAKLLRAIEDREIVPVGAQRPIAVDVRIIAAAQGRGSSLRAKELRADLYHRVCESLIEIPPLRTRRPDIRLLADHFLAEIGSAQRLSSAAYQALERCAWPGNVRELRSVIRRAALLHADTELLEPACLFEIPLTDSQRDADLGRLLDCRWDQAKDEFARWYWTNVWQTYAGDRQRIAEHTRVSDVWLRSRRRLYGLHDGQR
jgi:transcriptional regulator with PAS, ATPase and Fis domain